MLLLQIRDRVSKDVFTFNNSLCVPYLLTLDICENVITIIYEILYYTEKYSFFLIHFGIFLQHW